MERTRRILFRVLFIALILFIPLGALANDMDISLGRLAYPCRGAQTPVPCQNNFHKLIRDYSFAFSPKILAPAETLGYDGFYAGLEGALTPVDSGAAYMKEGTVIQGSSDAIIFIPALHIRKGLPWSIELGSSLNYMANSELVAMGAEVKWSLFEGFRKPKLGYLPDVAVRASVMRLLGSSDIDLTIVGLDASISRPFAVSGEVIFTPYLGYQFLWSFVYAESVVVGQRQNELLDQAVVGKDAVFQFKKETLYRHRPFVGFRFIWEHLTFTPEVSLGLGDNKVAVQPAFALGADF